MSGTRAVLDAQLLLQHIIVRSKQQGMMNSSPVSPRNRTSLRHSSQRYIIGSIPMKKTCGRIRAQYVDPPAHIDFHQIIMSEMFYSKVLLL
jgi:hypothetical protein